MVDYLYHQQTPLDILNDEGQSPLQIAIHEEHFDLIRYLISHNPDTDVLKD